jgi:hypothetical protein
MRSYQFCDTAFRGSRRCEVPIAGVYNIVRRLLLYSTKSRFVHQPQSVEFMVTAEHIRALNLTQEKRIRRSTVRRKWLVTLLA